VFFLRRVFSLHFILPGGGGILSEKRPNKRRHLLLQTFLDVSPGIRVPWKVACTFQRLVGSQIQKNQPQMIPVEVHNKRTNLSRFNRAKAYGNRVEHYDPCSSVSPACDDPSSVPSDPPAPPAQPGEKQHELAVVPLPYALPPEPHAVVVEPRHTPLALIAVLRPLAPTVN
jgi:hypothetical protein